MKMIQIEIHFLWFVVYSVIGWSYETALCSFLRKGFVNRGFLNGPYCPIYGFGALLIILLLGGIKHPLLLFLAATLVTGSLEYLTSWAMEKLFHARWWDYSDKPFNIKGRVYLRGLVVFGIFALLLVHGLHPLMASLTAGVPADTRRIVALALFSFLLTDTVYTVTKFAEFEDILRGMSHSIDDALQSIKNLYGRANLSYSAALRKANSQVHRMILAFPKLSSTSYGESLKKLKAIILAEKNKK